MLEITFNYKEWRNLEGKIEDFPEELLDATTRGAVKHAKSYLKSRIKWNRGGLISSINSTSTSENINEIHAHGKPATYEKYVHDGRGRFSAKNKLALHWVNKQGEDVFVRKPKKVAAFAGYYHYREAEEKTGSNINKYIREAANTAGL